jgi:hypothetical protein
MALAAASVNSKLTLFHEFIVSLSPCRFIKAVILGIAKKLPFWTHTESIFFAAVRMTII